MKNKINEMMSSIPTEKGENVDLQILRIGIISEMDAISLYEQLSSIATNEKIKKIFLDIAKEEKTHVGEFEALLLKYDKEYKTELNSGSKEVENISGPNDDMNEARKRIYGRTSTDSLNEMTNLFKKLIK